MATISVVYAVDALKSIDRALPSGFKRHVGDFFSFLFTLPSDNALMALMTAQHNKAAR